MVPGIEVLEVVAAQILANLGSVSVKRMLKRRKKKRDSGDAEPSTTPVRIGSQELEESANLASVLERVERLEQRQQDERVANVLSILEKTVEALADKDVPGQQPDSRWVSVFTESAQHASTDELRDTWARILAGETERPGSISVRTLTVLDGLNQQTALLFRQLCSISMSVSHPTEVFRDCRAASLGGNAASNALREYGLGFDALNVLNEHGLIISDYNSWFDYRNCIAQQISGLPGWSVFVAIRYRYEEWGLIPEDERDTSKELRIHGVSLSRTGRELFSVVELLSVPSYDQALSDYFGGMGLRMERIGDRH